MKSYIITVTLETGDRYEYLIEAESIVNAINLLLKKGGVIEIENISEDSAILDIAEMIISHRILYK